MGITKEPILICEGLKKTFQQNKKAESVVNVLSGVELTVNNGDLIAIVGASVSGKSTLLHLLGGLDKPDAGKVLWHDKDIFSLTLDQLARLRGKTVGFVFQFHHLLNEFTALENIMLPMLIQGASVNDAKRKALSLLERLTLIERKDHRPNELSGGEQQRIAIARALANSPDILLADEPTGNLDAQNSAKLYEILVELNKTDGLTTIVVTHNKELAEKCDKLYQLSNGKLSLL